MTLDQILAILTGRKEYDAATGAWRVYDANGNELTAPSGALWRGVHGALLWGGGRLGQIELLTFFRRRARR